MSVIVGLGSPHGDDRLGWECVDRLRPRLPVGMAAHMVGGGLELLDCLHGHDAAVVIDAAAPAGRPGLIRSFLWPSPELAQCAVLSTHGLGLVETLKLAAALDRLPRHLIIHTIEAQETSPTATLSNEVVRQLDALAEQVLAEVVAIAGKTAATKWHAQSDPVQSSERIE